MISLYPTCQKEFIPRSASGSRPQICISGSSLVLTSKSLFLGKWFQSFKAKIARSITDKNFNKREHHLGFHTYSMWLETVYSIKKKKTCSKTTFDFQVTRKKFLSLLVSSCLSLHADKPDPKLSDSTVCAFPIPKEGFTDWRVLFYIRCFIYY